MKNTLAYFGLESMAAKRFMIQAPGVAGVMLANSQMSKDLCRSVNKALLSNLQMSMDLQIFEKPKKVFHLSLK